MKRRSFSCRLRRSGGCSFFIISIFSFSVCEFLQCSIHVVLSLFLFSCDAFPFFFCINCVVSPHVLIQFCCMFCILVCVLRCTGLEADVCFAIAIVDCLFIQEVIVGCSVRRRIEYVLWYVFSGCFFVYHVSSIIFLMHFCEKLFIFFLGILIVPGFVMRKLVWSVLVHSIVVCGVFQVCSCSEIVFF